MPIDKIMEPTKVADRNEHIELEIMNTLKAMYEEAKKKGYSGTQEQYMKTLSLDELKRVGVSKGGLIKMSELNTKEKLEALKDVNRAHYEYRHKNQKGVYKKI